MLTVSIVGARALYYLGGRARWLGHSLRGIGEGRWMGVDLWMWIVFAALVAGLLALDLGVLHRDDRPIASACARPCG